MIRPICAESAIKPQPTIYSYIYNEYLEEGQKYSEQLMY